MLELPRPTCSPLHLSVNATEGWLEAIEYGEVVDGRLAESFVELTPDVRFVLRGPHGPVIGFVVRGFAEVDFDALGPIAFAAGPRFSVPVLGLGAGSLGEVVLAARGRFTASTADVRSFDRALRCAEEGDLDAAAGHWLSCLEAGDMRGMFGLGYTLFDLGRPVEAYTHLRRYSELAPHNSWAWLWLGRTCEALAEREEAVAAYRTAIRCERDGSFRTDARHRLRDLERGGEARSASA